MTDLARPTTRPADLSMPYVEERPFWFDDVDISVDNWRVVMWLKHVDIELNDWRSIANLNRLTTLNIKPGLHPAHARRLSRRVMYTTAPLLALLQSLPPDVTPEVRAAFAQRLATLGQIRTDAAALYHILPPPAEEDPDEQQIEQNYNTAWDIQ